jgi:hypothetical protein
MSLGSDEKLPCTDVRLRASFQVDDTPTGETINLCLETIIPKCHPLVGRVANGSEHPLVDLATEKHEIDPQPLSLIHI